MATENLKSPSIVNLDASPVVANTVGEGAPGLLRMINDSVLTTAGVVTPSSYRLCRIPTDAKIKHVFWRSLNAPGAGAVDIDIAFSDSTSDGTQQSFATLANPVVQVTGPADNKLFGAATTVPTTGTIAEVTYAGTFVAAHRNLPLWQVLVNLGATQFTADPGGYFDLFFNVTTAITNAVNINAEIVYVE